MRSEIGTVSVQGGLEQLEEDSDGDGVMADGCNKEFNSEKSESELTMFMLEAGSVLKND